MFVRSVCFLTLLLLVVFDCLFYHHDSQGKAEWYETGCKRHFINMISSLMIVKYKSQ